MSRRILVTGGGGFIGRQCLRPLLDAGFDVHATSRGAGVPVDGVHWHGIDLFDTDAVNRLLASVAPTHLLQMAWDTTPGRYWTTLDNLDWMRATLAVTRAFVRNGGQHLVTAGTCAEYDWRFGWCSEQVTPASPKTLYGSTKHALQQALTAYAKQAGIRAAWGRMFFVYGPWEHPARFIPSIIQNIRAGNMAVCAAGNYVRDFLHVEDAGRAFAALAAAGLEGVFNIASGHGVALCDVATHVADAMGRPDLLRIDTASTASEPPLLIGDSRRLMSEAAWTPRVNLTDGLDTAVDWWRTRLEAAGR